MSNGYDLARERLEALPEVQELLAEMEAVIRTVRPVEYRFKLQVPVDEAPFPFVEWKVVHDFNLLGSWHSSDGINPWNVVSGVQRSRRLDAIANESYPDRTGRVYPCNKEVLVYGRKYGQKGGFLASFSDWVMSKCMRKWQDILEGATARCESTVDSMMDSPEFQEASWRALRELAADDLSDRMVLFSRIPGVVERAGELYVVKGVMES
jgi:hypothetical protein